VMKGKFLGPSAATREARPDPFYSNQETGRPRGNLSTPVHVGGTQRLGPRLRQVLMDRVGTPTRLAKMRPVVGRVRALCASFASE
jgi:hypothetical protein